MDFAKINEVNVEVLDEHRIAWSPTMDLVAIVTTDNAIVIHRLMTWHRLLSIVPADASVEFGCVRWSTDGRQVVGGTLDGAYVGARVGA